MRGLLVCFSGIDGSGKTTLCKEVVARLQSYRIPSRYVYGRFLPVVVAPLFKITSVLMLPYNDPKKYRATRTRHESKRQLLRNPTTFRLFVLGILLDQLLRILIKVSLRSIFKEEVIICDRYLFDTVITDVAFSCGLDDNKVTQILQQWISIFPKADLIFIMDVPPKIAHQRKNEIYSIAQLDKLSNMYLRVGEEFGATIIDGTRDLLDLAGLVLKKLESIGVSAN